MLILDLCILFLCKNLKSIHQYILKNILGNWFSSAIFRWKIQYVYNNFVKNTSRSKHFYYIKVLPSKFRLTKIFFFRWKHNNSKALWFYLTFFCSSQLCTLDAFFRQIKLFIRFHLSYGFSKIHQIKGLKPKKKG